MRPNGRYQACLLKKYPDLMLVSERNDHIISRPEFVMLVLFATLGGLLLMMGLTPARSRCFTTSGSKIKFQRIIFYGSLIGMSALISCARS